MEERQQMEEGTAFILFTFLLEKAGSYPVAFLQETIKMTLKMVFDVHDHKKLIDWLDKHGLRSPNKKT